MSSPMPIEELFGPGATQDADTLTISKAWMSQFGLAPDPNNNPEGLFLAIIAQAGNYASESRRAINRDAQYLTVTPAGYDGIEDIPGSNARVRRDVITVIKYLDEPVTAFSLAQFNSTLPL